MKRDKWTTQIRAIEVGELCYQRSKEHREREKMYELAASQAEKDLKEKGIELREHQVTGGGQIQAVLDPERHGHLQDVRRRRDRHRSKAEDYEAVLNLVERMGNAQVEVDADDIAWLNDRVLE